MFLIGYSVFPRKHFQCNIIFWVRPLALIANIRLYWNGASSRDKQSSLIQTFLNAEVKSFITLG